MAVGDPHVSFAALSRKHSGLPVMPNCNEGDIGGYPILQYRKKKWQIPKYRVENRLNTDTAYFNFLYDHV